MYAKEKEDGRLSRERAIAYQKFSFEREIPFEITVMVAGTTFIKTNFSSHFEILPDHINSGRHMKLILCN